MRIALDRKVRPLIFGLLAVGFLLRIVALDHGFPDVNEEATPVRQAWEMWDWESGGIDPNPAFFNYPALTFYINWAAQAIYRLITDPIGLRDWGPAESLPLDLVLIGRILAVLFSVGIAVVTWMLGRRLMPDIWAAWAGVIVFWMPTLFHYSVLSIVDLPLALCATFILYELTRRPPASLRRHLYFGMLVALAASCKYTGAFLAVPYVIALLVSNGWRVRPTFVTPGPWLAGLTSVVLFFALNPYILLDYETFRWHFAFERHHMSVGHFGRRHSAWVEYAGALWQNLGPVFLLSLVLGAVGASRSRRRRLWLPLIGFGILYPGFLAVWSTSFGHYLFPVFPVFVLLAVAGLRMVAGVARPVLSRTVLRTALPLVAMAPLLYGTVDHLSRYLSPAARTLARQWIEANTQEGAIVVTEPGGPLIQPPRSMVMLPMHTTNPEQAAPAYNPKWLQPVDLMAVVEGVEARYAADPERFPDQRHVYEYLDEHWEQVARFGRPGTGIRVYRNPDGDRSDIRAYPDTLYARLGGMSRVLAGRFLDRLGKAFKASGRLWLAGDVYNRLATNLPDEQDYTLAYADVLLALDRRDMAVRLLESRRETGDDHMLASLHYMKGNYDSAAVAWQRFGAARSDNLALQVNLGRNLLAMGQTRGALDLFLRAVEGDIDDVEPYVRAARILAEAGRNEEAGAVVRRALEKWPDHPDLQALLR